MPQKKKKIVLFLTYYFHNLLRWHWVKKPTPCLLYQLSHLWDRPPETRILIHLKCIPNGCETPHLLSQLPEHPGGSPGGTDVAVRACTEPGLGTGLTRQHRPGRSAGPRDTFHTKADAKVPVVSLPVQVNPPDCDPAELGEKGGERKGPDRGWKGNGGAGVGAAPPLHPPKGRCGQLFLFIASKEAR